MKIAHLFLMVIAAGGLANAGRADDELPDHKLSEWRLGNGVGESKVDLTKMEGKVVAIEYWGVD